MGTNLELARAANHDYFGKLDMISAYSQIPLPEELQLYTMFRMGEQIYCFTTLPFGMSISSHVFTTYLAIHLQMAKARYLSTLVPGCVKRIERDTESAVSERISHYLKSQDETDRKIAWQHLENTRPKLKEGEKHFKLDSENQRLPRKVW
jgi:hypothetical protein